MKTNVGFIASRRSPCVYGRHSEYYLWPGSVKKLTLRQPQLFELVTGNRGDLMGDVNGEQFDPPNGQDPERDYFYLFTPLSDINCRVNVKDYIAFVGAMEDAISAHCRNDDPDDTVSFQIGCALLPGGKKLIEIDVIPKESPAFHARQLGEVINQIASPEVSNGPIVCSRRRHHRGHQKPYGGFGMPFARLVQHRESIWLDTLVMEASSTSQPNQTFWTMVTNFFRTKPKLIDTASEMELGQGISGRLKECKVIILSGRAKLTRE